MKWKKIALIAAVAIAALAKTTGHVAPTPLERMAEIDHSLNAPLTGTPEDVDRRVALTTERFALYRSYRDWRWWWWCRERWSWCEHLVEHPWHHDQERGERIAEIDRVLKGPLTGTPEDLARRLALRAERANLAGPSNHTAANNHTVANNQSAAVGHQASQSNAEQQEHNRLVALQQENLRNIEHEKREQAQREREQTSSSTAFKTQRSQAIHEVSHQAVHGKGGAQKKETETHNSGSPDP